jgi:hypothetical protein
MVEVRYNAVDMNVTKKLYGSSSGNYINEISDVQPTGGIEKLTTYENVANYISFDGLGIDLYDDNSKFYEDGDFVGALSSNISDVDGNYSGFDMTVEMLSEDFVAGGKRVSIEFYNKSCKSCVVKLYELENGNVQEISSKNLVFSPNNADIGNVVFEDSPSTEKCWISVFPTETNAPYSFIKIQRLLIGNVEVLQGIKDINITEEINILSEDLPLNQLDCSITSETPIDFASSNPLSVYSNGKFFGTFYVDDIVRKTDVLYSLKAYSSLYKTENLLKWNEKYFSFKDINNLISTENEKKYIDIELENKKSDDIYIYGFMGSDTKRKMICAIAWSLNMWVDNSRSDIVRLKEYPKEITTFIGNDRIIGEATFEKSEAISQIIYEVDKPKEIGEYFSGEYKDRVDGQPIEHLWEANTPAELVETTNIDIVKKDLYGFDGYFEFEGEGNVTFFVAKYTGRKFAFKRAMEGLSSANKNALKIKDLSLFNLCAATYSIEDPNATFDPEDPNAIFFDKSEIAQKYINSRGVVKAKIRLRDEKIGDMVTIPTAWDGEITGMITYMNIDFGYEDVADVEITQWSV